METILLVVVTILVLICLAFIKLQFKNNKLNKKLISLLRHMFDYNGRG